MRLPLRRLLLPALLGAALVQPAMAEGFTDDQRAELDEAIRAYILANPEVLIEALSMYQDQQAVAEADRQRQQVIARQDELYNTPGTPFLGNQAGDVTVVEFFDYQCGYCKRVVGDVFQASEDDPGLRIVFKDFPILGPTSVVAARAALAAREQGLYIPFHNALLSYQGGLTDDTVFQIAAAVGLDVDRLRADMDDPAIMRELQANIELAQAIGVNGTPAFVIGEQVVPGAISLQMLQQLIAGQRSG